MKAILIAFLIFLYFFNFVITARAAGFTLYSSQSSINASDELNVNVSFFISSANGTTYYLRGVFYQTAGNYCGYTWNGNVWYNGPYSVNNSWQQLFPVTINQGSWSGQLKAKIDISDSNCQNSGNYYFKIQRYTGGGSSSFDDQNSLTLNITIPTPTPSPTSTPTPQPTNSPTPTQILPINTSKTPTPTIFKKISSTDSLSNDVLSVSTQSSQSPTQEIKKNSEDLVAGISDNTLLPKILIFIGFIFILSCVIVIFYPRIKEMFGEKFNG